MKNKSYILLVAGSLVAGSSWLAAAWSGAGLGQAQKAIQNIERSEQNLTTLKDQLARWEKVGAVAMPSVEPVALTGKFAPGELPRSAQLLLGLYTDHGYFNLKQFKFSWAEAGEEGSGGMGVATMSVEGDKVFLGKRDSNMGAAPANVLTSSQPTPEKEVLVVKGEAK